MHLAQKSEIALKGDLEGLEATHFPFVNTTLLLGTFLIKFLETAQCMDKHTYVLKL